VIGAMEREDMGTNVTRAAEGFDRRSFTVAEILRMQDAGIIAEDESFELIEGAARRATFVHQGPQGAGWRSIAERGPDQALAVAALPGFSMRLATI
jgi:hypothetical protein